MTRTDPAAPDLAAATPLRTAGHGEREDGVVVIGRSAIRYADGGEQAVLETLRSLTDVSSLSAEIDVSTREWNVAYHLLWPRANVVRAFDLPADARVLEIGAGCGAITRYLGESCEVVDALEPMLPRAVAARERCRDLPGVEVFAGELEDVPDEPAYDVIAVIGVLEYVGGGGADLTPYRDFLAGVRRRLRPGGRLLLAIENRLGAKYLAGEPEDHNGRSFDGPEGYAHPGTPARTFDQPALAALLGGAGLDAEFFSAFPDYKLTRTVFGAAAGREAPELTTRLPRFPSAPWGRPSGATVSEELLWRSLAGTAGPTMFGNSFVVVATAAGGQAASPIWPADRLAVLYSTGRAVDQSARTDFLGRDGSISLRRGLLLPDRAAFEGATVRHLPADDQQPYVRGEEFVDLLVDADPARAADLLRGWVSLVEQHHRGGHTLLDLLPANLLVDDAGELRIIDQEWESPSLDADDVVRRGLLLTAWRMAELAPLTRWEVGSTGELARWLADLVDRDEPGWLDDAVATEASIQFEASGTRAARSSLEVAAAMQARLDQPYADTLWGRRDHVPGERTELIAALDHSRAETATAHAAVAAIRADNDAAFARLNAEIHAMQAERQAMLASTSWRVTALLRKVSTLRRR